MADAAREQALQADVKWLDDLTRTLSDQRYARLRKLLASAPITAEMRAHGITEEIMRTGFGLDGAITLASQARAAITNLPSMNDFDRPPTDFMFAYPSIPTVNGFAIKTPNLGAAAIVLNHGLVSYLAALVHLVLGLTRWADGPYCTHCSDEARLDGLMELAEAIRGNVPYPLLRIAATNCIGHPDHAQVKELYELTCNFAEYFLIFHEIAHCLLGHLDPQDVTFSFGPVAGQPVAVFNRSQQNEADADEFAYRQLVRLFVSESGSREADVLFGVGCLLTLSELVEKTTSSWAPETHPPASARWSALRHQQADRRPSVLVDTVDALFAWTAQGGSGNPIAQTLEGNA